ncbi:hypothetical protein [Marinobacter sp.]|uniref:hypothetical protein n=1 Tax=Marinobacter sp. TaxID=50741 RepID=UPI0034A230EA
MGNKIKGLILASALIAGTASADLRYTYAEGGIAIVDADYSQTFLGFDLRGSYLVNENIFAFGGLRMLTDDLDYTNWHLGGAYRHALDAKTDVWAGASLEYQEIDGGKECFATFSGTECHSWSFDDTAPAIRGGIRHQFDENIELGASARIVTGDLDYVGLTGQGRYRIQDDLSVTGEVDLQDGNLGLFGGVTYFF